MDEVKVVVTRVLVAEVSVNMIASHTIFKVLSWGQVGDEEMLFCLLHSISHSGRFPGDSWLYKSVLPSVGYLSFSFNFPSHFSDNGFDLDWSLQLWKWNRAWRSPCKQSVYFRLFCLLKFWWVLRDAFVSCIHVLHDWWKLSGSTGSLLVLLHKCRGERLVSTVLVAFMWHLLKPSLDSDSLVNCWPVSNLLLMKVIEMGCGMSILAISLTL